MRTHFRQNLERGEKVVRSDQEVGTPRRQNEYIRDGTALLAAIITMPATIQQHAQHRLQGCMQSVAGERGVVGSSFFEHTVQASQVRGCWYIWRYVLFKHVMSEWLISPFLYQSEKSPVITSLEFDSKYIVSLLRRKQTPKSGQCNVKCPPHNTASVHNGPRRSISHCLLAIIFGIFWLRVAWWYVIP